MHVERISRDSDCFNTIKPYLDRYAASNIEGTRHENTSCVSKTDAENQGPSAQETTAVPIASWTTKKYCWCQGGECGNMIACDNQACTRECFHFEWVGLTRKLVLQL